MVNLSFLGTLVSNVNLEDHTDICDTPIFETGTNMGDDNNTQFMASRKIQLSLP